MKKKKIRVCEISTKTDGDIDNNYYAIIYNIIVSRGPFVREYGTADDCNTRGDDEVFRPETIGRQNNRTSRRDRGAAGAIIKRCARARAILTRRGGARRDKSSGFVLFFFLKIFIIIFFFYFDVVVDSYNAYTRI